MDKLTREERRARIHQLEQELAMLRAQEVEEQGADSQDVLEACRALKRANQPMQAIRLYRDKMGCGLREAHDAVQVL
jgi:ribosomal protein L7/L12